ncbi:MAG: hypothetical protein KC516_04280 [Nanoarchaeota archaeon]|nr:hypothetical protein [Nanoarchaeota archaeon]
MVDQGLIDYVKSHLDNGFSIDEIRQGLLSQHLSQQEVEEAITAAKAMQYGGLAKPVPGLEEAKIESVGISNKTKWIIGIVILFVIVGGLIAYLFLNAKPAKVVVSVSEFSLIEGISVDEISEDSVINLSLDGEVYSLVVQQLKEDYLVFTGDIDKRFDMGDSFYFDMNNDGEDDLEISLESINSYQATIYFSKVISTNDCDEDWNCTEWGSCVDNLMIRFCVDSNGCGSEENKPQTVVNCSSFEVNLSGGNETNGEINLSCNLDSEFSGEVSLDINETKNMSVSGFNDSSLIYWVSNNETVISLNDSSGGEILVSALDMGDAEVFVFDDSIGESCNLTIGINVS